MLYEDLDLDLRFGLTSKTGLGVCSCILAQCGIEVTATDRDEMALANLRMVAQKNSLSERIQVAELVWGNHASYPHLYGRFKV